MTRFIVVAMLALLLHGQVVFAEGSQPPSQEEILACQRNLAKETERLTGELHSLLGRCLKSISSNDIDPARICAKNTTRFHAAKANARFRMIHSCTNVHPELLGYPCDREAYDEKDTADCLVESSSRAVQVLVGLEYSSACDMLNHINLNLTYYHLCGL